MTVLSYKFWQRHFIGDADVLGRTLQLDHKNYQIVGVAAPRFTWSNADVCVNETDARSRDNFHCLFAIEARRDP